MEKVILHIKNGIAEIHNYLLFVMAQMVIISYISGKAPGFFILAALGVLPLIYYLIRCKIHNFWFFCALHVVPIFLIWILIDDFLATKIIFITIAFLQAAFSIGTRIAVYTRPERDDYGSAIVLPFFIGLLGTSLYLVSRDTRLVVIIIIITVLHFSHMYLSHFLHYIDMSSRTTGNVPVKDILATDLALVGGFMLIMVSFMSLFIGRDLLLGLGGWLLSLLRKLFALLDFFASRVSENEATVQENQGLQIEEIVINEPSDFAIVLEYIFEIVSSVVIVVGTILLIYITIILIRNVFRGRARGKKLSEDGDIDVVEKIKRTKNGRKDTAKRSIFLTADEKIRRIFVKLIRKKKEKLYGLNNEGYLIRDGSTARELLILFDDQPESAGLIVALYEKARYARESCTNADVRTARKLAGTVK